MGKGLDPDLFLLFELPFPLYDGIRRPYVDNRELRGAYLCYQVSTIDDREEAFC